jgi:hypothetical protein
LRARRHQSCRRASLRRLRAEEIQQHRCDYQ